MMTIVDRLLAMTIQLLRSRLANCFQAIQDMPYIQILIIRQMLKFNIRLLQLSEPGTLNPEPLNLYTHI